jgi:hypothetical protein
VNLIAHIDVNQVLQLTQVAANPLLTRRVSAKPGQ